jgi:intein-encoded DNA endonuclease-like protein
MFGVSHRTILDWMIKVDLPRRSQARQHFPREQIEKLYQEQHMSTREIAKELKCGQSTVRRLMKGYNIPRRDYRIYPNLAPTPSLCYSITVLLCDGTTYMTKSGSRAIDLRVKEKEFAILFYNALKEIGLHPHLHFNRGLWEVLAYSRKFFDFYQKLSIGDLERIALKSKMNALAILKAAYESEGSTYSYAICCISNTNLSLALFIKRLLEQFGFHPHLYGPYANRKNKPMYYLRIYRKTERERFIELTAPCIKVPHRLEK